MGRLEAPVRPSQRTPTIDIRRGFAILGILLVNFELYSRWALDAVASQDLPSTPWDQLAAWCIAFLAEGKFYSIFSFLFGLSMAIQYGRTGVRLPSSLLDLADCRSGLHMTKRAGDAAIPRS